MAIALRYSRLADESLRRLGLPEARDGITDSVSSMAARGALRRLADNGTGMFKQGNLLVAIRRLGRKVVIEGVASKDELRALSKYAPEALVQHESGQWVDGRLWYENPPKKLRKPVFAPALRKALNKRFGKVTTDLLIRLVIEKGFSSWIDVIRWFF